jgi:hypothetical protein
MKGSGCDAVFQDYSLQIIGVYSADMIGGDLFTALIKY